MGKWFIAVGVIGYILYWWEKRDWGKACDYLDAVEDGDIDKIMELNEEDG